MTHTLIDSLDEAVENIKLCQTEIRKDPRVAERMPARARLVCGQIG